MRIFFLPLLTFAWISVGCSDSPKVVQAAKTNNFPEFDSLPKAIVVAPVIEKLTKKETVQVNRLDSFISLLVKQKVFNGNILVAKKGKILYTRSCGVANSKTKKPLSVNSVFQLASVSKTLTSTLLLVLAEEGKIDIKKTVSTYLTDFPYKNVTVENLLTHRSGLPDYTNFTTDYVKPDSLGFFNKDIYAVMVKNVPKIYGHPNKVFDYSNTNYFLLSVIAEKVTGKPFEKLMRDKILAPLGMKSTYFFSEVSKIPDSLKTTGHDEKMKRLYPEHYDQVKGDKGIYSTINDLFLFLEAYYANKIISKEMRELATSPKSPEKKKTNYGYGWRMKEFDTPEKIVFHNGWWRGYRTALHRIFKDSTTVVVLTNNLNLTAYRVKDFYQVMHGISLNKDQSDNHHEH